MSLDPARLQRRKQGREWAKQVLELVDLPHPDCVDAFLDELARTLTPVIMGEIEKRHIEEQQTVAELSATMIQFGKYAKSTFGEIVDYDRQYLEWLRDSSQETADALGTYLELTEPDGGE